MKNTIIIVLMLYTGFAALAQTGIGTVTPDASAMLELQSTDRGFLPPRMTEMEMNAISNPAEGLIVYCTDCDPKGLYVFEGSIYISLITGNASAASATLTCGSTVVTGTANEGVALSGVSITLPYTDGNAGAFSAGSWSSTGVTGLTASLLAGNLASGTGSLVLTVTGTPSGPGTASFSIDANVASTACTITIDIITPCTNCDMTTPVVDVTSATGKVWMDRNLGATQVATSSTDTNSYGDLYQWGRGADGHEQRTSGNTTTTVTSADPGHGDFIIAGAGTDYNWTDFAGEDNLWQGVNGINNPCPSGYRIPTQAEWLDEKNTLSINNAADAFNSVLKLPVAGYRDWFNGLFYEVDSIGRYWSYTLHTTNEPLSLVIQSGSFGTNQPWSRAHALSVRCIKD